MIKCPKCGKELPPSDISLRELKARCSSCSHGFFFGNTPSDEEEPGISSSSQAIPAAPANKEVPGFAPFPRSHRNPGSDPLNPIAGESPETEILGEFGLSDIPVWPILIFIVIFGALLFISPAGTFLSNAIDSAMKDSALQSKLDQVSTVTSPARVEKLHVFYYLDEWNRAVGVGIRCVFTDSSGKPVKTIGKVTGKIKWIMGQMDLFHDTISYFKPEDFHLAQTDYPPLKAGDCYTELWWVDKFGIGLPEDVFSLDLNFEFKDGKMEAVIQDVHAPPHPVMSKEKVKRPDSWP